MSPKRVPVFDFTKEEPPGSDERTWVPSVFTKGGAPENRPPPGGREKHAYFLEMRPEPTFKGTGRLRQDL